MSMKKFPVNELMEIQKKINIYVSISLSAYGQFNLLAVLNVIDFQ